MMPSDSRKSLFTSRSRTNYQLQEEQSKHVISDCDDKQQLNRIKSSSAHLSLEPALQLLKRSSGMVTWGLGGGGIKINLIIWISLSHFDTERLRSTHRLDRGLGLCSGAAERTVCDAGVGAGWKEEEKDHWGSLLTLLSSKWRREKAFKGWKKLNNWADPQNSCTQGLDYHNRNSSTTSSPHWSWHNVALCFYSNSKSASDSPVQLASVCFLGDQRLPKLMGVLDRFNGKVLKK